MLKWVFQQIHLWVQWSPCCTNREQGNDCHTTMHVTLLTKAQSQLQLQHLDAWGPCWYCWSAAGTEMVFLAAMALGVVPSSAWSWPARWSLIQTWKVGGRIVSSVPLNPSPPHPLHLILPVPSLVLEVLCAPKTLEGAVNHDGQPGAQGFTFLHAADRERTRITSSVHQPVIRQSSVLGY